MTTCVDCVFLCRLTKHPWNKGEFRGSISEPVGFGCMYFMEHNETDTATIMIPDVVTLTEGNLTRACEGWERRT